MDTVSLLDVVNGWQAGVLIALIIGPQVPAWITAMRTHRLLNHETKPNSGSSLRDQVDLANRRLVRVLDGQDDHERRITRLESPTQE